MMVGVALGARVAGSLVGAASLVGLGGLPTGGSTRLMPWAWAFDRRHRLAHIEAQSPQRIEQHDDDDSGVQAARLARATSE